MGHFCVNYVGLQRGEEGRGRRKYDNFGNVPFYCTMIASVCFRNNCEI